MDNVAGLLGAGASAVSVVVAIIAMHKSNAAQKRSTSAQIEAIEAQQQAAAAQRRIAEIAEQREHDRRIAAVKASLLPELRGSGNSERLYLVNNGDSEARNVWVELDGTPLAEHPTAVSNDPMPSLVGPHSEIGCLLAFTMGCAPPFEIRILWDDDSGEGRSYRTTLTW